MTETVGSLTDPIAQEFIWCEVDAAGRKKWYTLKAGLNGDIDVDDLMPKSGGTFTGDVHLPDHELTYDAMASSIAINKGDLERESLKIIKVSALPTGSLRPNTVYLVVSPNSNEVDEGETDSSTP